ncbi:MAG: transporter [Solirubrobacterales bacterium]|nr:transporter [Solirubrobacterales bacterium]
MTARIRASATLPTLILACVAQFMVILDVSIVNVALPAIRHGLHFSATNLQWVVNAYTLTFAGFLLLGGRAADLLGRRLIFISGLLLFAGASLVGGIAHNETTLIAARAAQGLGGAVVSPATLAILTTTFKEGSSRNRALGVWGAMGAAGGTTGALLGGVLTDLVGWRWILFVNVPIGIAAAVLATRYIVESKAEGQTRHFDVAGAVTVTLGLVAIVFGIVRADVDGWGSARVLGSLVGGVVLIAAFLAIEGKFATAPLMPLRILRSRVLSAANVIVFLLGGAMFGMWYFVSLYLQQVLGFTPIEAGLSFVPMTLSIMVGSTVASRLVQRFGVQPLLIVGMLAQAAGLLLFAEISPTGSYLGDVLAPSLLVAGGMGIAFVPVTIAAMGGVQAREAGLASGLVNTSRQMGGALGLAILSSVATAHTNGLLAAHRALGTALTDGFHRAFVVAALFAFLGAVVAVSALRGTRPARQAERADAAVVEAA